MKRMFVVFFVIMVLVTACETPNRLANTTWEGHESDGRVSTIIFGGDSFQLKSKSSFDGTESVWPGTYKISGDAIEILTPAILKQTGSLVGDTLAIFNKEYKQIKK